MTSQSMSAIGITGGAAVTVLLSLLMDLHLQHPVVTQAAEQISESLSDEPEQEMWATSFSSDEPDGIVPSQVAEHSLVRIRSPYADAQFQDVEVITAVNNTPQYVDVIQAAEPGVWFFTGPPADYACKVAGFYPDQGLMKKYGNVRIGGGPRPPPGPDPDPEPEPDPGPEPEPEPDPEPSLPEDQFDNLAISVHRWAGELQLDATDKVAANYREASDRLSGRLQPVLPTIDLAMLFLQEENKKLDRDAERWNRWGDRVAPVWQRHFPTDGDARAFAAEFFGLVADGLEAID